MTAHRLLIDVVADFDLFQRRCVGIVLLDKRIDGLPLQHGGNDVDKGLGCQALGAGKVTRTQSVVEGRVHAHTDLGGKVVQLLRALRQRYRVLRVLVQGCGYAKRACMCVRERKINVRQGEKMM